MGGIAQNAYAVATPLIIIILLLLHILNNILSKYYNYEREYIKECIKNEYRCRFKNELKMPTDEPINRFVLYESKVRKSLRPGAQTRTYRKQISSHLLPGEKALEATEIWKIAVKNLRGTNILSCLRRKSLRTDLLSSNDDDDDDEK